MKREEYENNMIRPRSWEYKDYSRTCECCDNGIENLQKYYLLPIGSYGMNVEWCDRCTEDHLSYAKYATKCICCGEDIAEDADCFVSDDAECICLDCLEEMSAINQE